MSQNTSKSAAKSRQSLFSWKISPEDLNYQVANYSELKISESYRGVATLLVLLSFGLAVILWGFGITSSDTLIGAAALYLPTAFFVYKGHRWAIVFLIVLWTVDKGYQMILTPNIMLIFWWLFFMPYFYKALRVEIERRKLKPVAVSISREHIFCPKCGSRQDNDTKYCTHCGFKLMDLHIS